MTRYLEVSATVLTSVLSSILAPLTSSSGGVAPVPTNVMVEACAGCVATQKTDEGYLLGAKWFVAGANFGLTGSFDIVDQGRCHWAQEVQNGPYGCLEEYPCEFRGK